jgi:hypothetical protein
VREDGDRVDMVAEDAEAESMSSGEEDDDDTVV